MNECDDNGNPRGVLDNQERAHVKATDTKMSERQIKWGGGGEGGDLVLWAIRD